MNIFVYSDESGVFDKVHNDIYVYGGIIFLSKEEKDNNVRKYLNVEKTIRYSGKYSRNYELKATNITNKEKNKIFRSLNNCIKFGVVINQNKIYDSIFEHKKTKQRYLDYAYLMGLKNVLVQLIEERKIDREEEINIYIWPDEHTTATDGYYELKESLETEFKIGKTNFKTMKYHHPIFKNLKCLSIKKGAKSEQVTLIRAADIIANKIYYEQINNINKKRDNLYLYYLP